MFFSFKNYLLNKKNFWAIFCLITFLLITITSAIGQRQSFDMDPISKNKYNTSLNFWEYKPYNDFPNSQELQNVNSEFKDPHIKDDLQIMGDNEWTTLGPLGWGSFYDYEISPHNPEIILAINSGIGLYKSIDGGINWSLANSI